MTAEPSTDPQALAESSAQILVQVFSDYVTRFKAITREAKGWFERCQWAEAQKGAVRRLDLYGAAVAQAKAEMRRRLGTSLENRALWAEIKREYARRIADRAEEEIAETFFNSVTRAVLTTVGVDEKVEFVFFDIEMLPSGDELPTYRSFHRLDDTRSVVQDILRSFAFEVPYRDAAEDAEKAARTIDAFLAKRWTFADFDTIEVAAPIFYRNKGAYLVGRIRRGIRLVPVVFALHNDDDGIYLDAVLLQEDLVSMVFSFARSYFFVDAVRPVELIGFLRSVMPLKPVAELYIALGYIKHGKTVRYRHLYRHLKHSSDRFRFAEGTKGMVMICFTLPSLDLVFKLIRDTFDYPKTSTPMQVKQAYDLIFKHNRVGRLIDAQEFEQLRFAKDRFEPDLLEELQKLAANTVQITDDEVIFAHCYTERRLNPLNVYVNKVNEEKAHAAVVEYGQAIKDLAAANVFPGDLLTKNFGVTRHGRVVFYDYDEVCLLSACRFRKLPSSHGEFGTHGGEMPMFVENDDIFPEEFRNFLWPAGPLRTAFETAHPDLFTVEFWRLMQTRNQQGEILDIYPYPERCRL